VSTTRSHGVTRVMRSALLVAAFAVGAMVTSEVAYGQQASAAKSPGVSNLVVRVTGLPGGAAAKVTVRGPRFSKSLRGSETLRRVRPGLYTFVVGKVKIARAQKGVRAGSEAVPVKSRVRVRVKSGRTARVRLSYGTIINANVRRLKLSPLSVEGDPTNPSRLTLPAASRATAGSILTAAPSAKLPAGLFHRVTAARRSGNRIVVTLKPAQLTDAFPQLDINARLNLAPGRVAVAKTRAFDPVVASLDIGKFSCQFPLGDSRLSARQSFNVDADVELNIPKRFGVPVGLPTGRLALTLKGSAALDSLIRKNAGCGASFPLPPLPGFIPVGPVVIPVYAQVSLNGSATVDADLDEKAGVNFTMLAGVTFHGTSVTNISTASGSATASATGAGKIEVGPSVRFAVGVPAAGDVHFDVQPSLAFTASLDGNCSLDVVGESQIGLKAGPFQLNQTLPAPSHNFYRCPPQPRLAITQSGPFGAFLDQAFNYTIRVTNSGSGPAHDVAVVNTLPTGGAFISSSPSGDPAAPGPGEAYAIPVGEVAPGETKTVTLRWRAPGTETTLTNSAVARSSNAPDAGPAVASVTVGTTANCNPCGAESAGTGLRNRDHGSITISGIPPGATVGRAVLVWGILFNGAVPANTITFDGHPIAADVTSSVSGNLCWGDTATVGYAADVTDLVTGNGTFNITDPQRGITRPDSDPFGVLPYTDGATLVVFYNGGGADNQVLSDFSYDTDTDADASIFRFFGAIHSVGGAASLTLAGPDGQVQPETIVVGGATDQILDNTWDGSDPQDGPSFAIGNLWDTDRYDVTGILPAGQDTLFVNTTHVNDCIGFGAAILQVSQHTG
jgi:uncharacterized repeat protein (TIGR01451 family)